MNTGSPGRLPQARRRRELEAGVGADRRFEIGAGDSARCRAFPQRRGRRSAPSAPASPRAVRAAALRSRSGCSATTSVSPPTVACRPSSRSAANRPPGRAGAPPTACSVRASLRCRRGRQAPGRATTHRPRAATRERLRAAHLRAAHVRGRRGARTGAGRRRPGRRRAGSRSRRMRALRPRVRRCGAAATRRSAGFRSPTRGVHRPRWHRSANRP